MLDAKKNFWLKRINKFSREQKSIFKGVLNHLSLHSINHYFSLKDIHKDYYCIYGPLETEYVYHYSAYSGYGISGSHSMGPYATTVGVSYTAGPTPREQFKKTESLTLFQHDISTLEREGLFAPQRDGYYALTDYGKLLIDAYDKFILER